jgi:hypothetical protein
MDDDFASLVRMIASAPALPVRDPMLGRLVSHYRLRARIGSGANGVVYRAFDETLHREVAIKLLREANTRSALGGVLSEARHAAAIAHPNVAAIYDVGEHDSHAFVAMELVPGRLLADAEFRRALEWREAVRVARAIASGVAVAHRRGFVHGDLKPDNVALDASGSPKILDFGMAGPTGARPERRGAERFAAGVLEGELRALERRRTRDVALAAGALLTLATVAAAIVALTADSPGYEHDLRAKSSSPARAARRASWIQAIAVSRDGERLMVADPDGLHLEVGGVRRLVWSALDDRIEAVAFFPDEAAVLVTGQRSAYRVSLDGESEVLDSLPCWGRAVPLSNATLVLACDDRLERVDLRSGAVTTLRAFTSDVDGQPRIGALDAIGGQVALARELGARSRIELVEVATGDARTVAEIAGAVAALAFASEGELVFAERDHPDALVELDLRSGERRSIPTGAGASSVAALAVPRDGGPVFLLARRDRAHVAVAHAGEAPLTFERVAPGRYPSAFSSSGAALWTAEVDPANGPCALVDLAHPGSSPREVAGCLAAVERSDGSRLWLASEEDSIVIRDQSTVRSVDGAAPDRYVLRCARDDTCFAGDLFTGDVRSWNDWRVVASAPLEPATRLTGFAVSLDGSRFAISKTRSAAVYVAERDGEWRSIPVPGCSVEDVEADATGWIVAAECAGNRNFYLLRVGSGAPSILWASDDTALDRLALSPDGRSLAARLVDIDSRIHRIGRTP